MFPSSNSAASNHADTASVLQVRGLEHKESHLKSPRPLEEVWAELEMIFPAVPGQNLLPLDMAKERLVAAMGADNYIGEEAFDQKLFTALQTCFNTYVISEETDKNFILDVGATDNRYAVGIARKVDCTRGIVHDNAESTSSGLAAQCEMDHGSCLFERIGNSWTATDIFSVVELKTSNTSCYAFQLVDNDRVGEVDLATQHGAFGQAIMYTMGSVLQYHAKNGALKHLESTTEGWKTIPIAVIAGIIGQVGKTKRLRWVSGDLLIPKACGNRFKYCLNNFGKFYHDENHELHSILLALSVYLDTILFGLRSALRVHRDRENQMPYTPDPLSGQDVMIGEQLVEWPVFASPIPRRTTEPNQAGSWQISQGELFAGELNVHEVLTRSRLGKSNYLEFGENNETVAVIIKVSSKAVHNPLITPSDTFMALKVVKRKIPSPLLAAILMEVGLVTIMADLSKQNYGMLRPADHRRNLASLWKGFKDLVINVLLPFAKRDVIHSDIRPGFDITTNILCKLDGDKVRMEIIDYESLVGIGLWSAPQFHRGYIAKESNWNGKTFVWWQCIAMAYAWIEERQVCQAKHQNSNAADIRSLQIGMQDTKPTWLPESLHKLVKEPRIKKKYVIETLDAIHQVFKDIDSADEL